VAKITIVIDTDRPQSPLERRIYSALGAMTDEPEPEPSLDDALKPEPDDNQPSLDDALAENAGADGAAQ